MPKNKYLEATTEKKDGQLIAIASTENPDRVGDELKLEDWDLKNFKKNPVLQAGHDYRPQYTIGIAKNIRIEDRKLVFNPHFHTETQLARDIKAMYEAEPAILKAWSVGFIPRALMTDENGNKLGKNELLEVSAVAVPANAEALTQAKSLLNEAEKYGEKEINSVEEWVKNEVEVKKIEKEEKKKEKSPKCRQDGESKDDCVKRKIPELIKEGKTQEEAVAIANSICDVKCSDKKKETEQKTEKKEKEEINYEEKIKDLENKLEKLEIDAKEGRVLSSKNRGLIKKTVINLKDTAVALEELLTLTEKPEKEQSKSAPEIKSEKETAKEKVVKPKVVNKPKVENEDKVVLQALQKLAGLSNKAIHAMKQKQK